jgi:hypothetical protein
MSFFSLVYVAALIRLTGEQQVISIYLGYGLLLRFIFALSFLTRVFVFLILGLNAWILSCLRIFLSLVTLFSKELEQSAK